MRGIERLTPCIGGGGGGFFSMRRWCPAIAREDRDSFVESRVLDCASSGMPQTRRVSDDRWQRLRAKTFRWNDGKTVEGYFAAEVISGSVTWFAWSHVHGEGRVEFGTQAHKTLMEIGPPIPVPAALLEEIHRALEASTVGAEEV